MQSWRFQFTLTGTPLDLETRGLQIASVAAPCHGQHFRRWLFASNLHRLERYKALKSTKVIIIYSLHIYFNTQVLQYKNIIKVCLMQKEGTYCKQAWKLLHRTKQLCHTNILSLSLVFFGAGLWRNWWICTLIQLTIFWRENYSIWRQLLSKTINHTQSQHKHNWQKLDDAELE